MSQFYNPYHFVPLNNNPQNEKESFKDIKSGKSIATHQLWKESLLSGSIFIALTNKSPLIIGGERPDDEGEPTHVSFYRQSPAGCSTKDAELAIPGNSLRGMISNVAETISDSSMRILDDSYFSSRMTPSQSPYSALGIVRAIEGKLYLEPLTYPTVRGKGRDTIVFNQEDDYNDEIFREFRISTGELNWEDYLKWCIPAYRKQGKELGLDKKFVFKDGTPLPCYHGSQADAYVYIYDGSKKSTPEDEELVIRSHNNNYYKCDNGFLNGLQFSGRDNDIFTHAEYERKKKENGFNEKHYTRAMLFWVEYTENDKSAMFNTKKYAYAIPYPKNKEGMQSRTKIPLSKKVIKRLENMLETNAESSMIPKSWQDIKGDKINKVTPGDIYYFTFDKDAENVTELSLSAIWRKEVSGASTYGLLRKNKLDNYLPFGERNSDTVDVVERLFGTVEELPEAAGKNTESARLLASRVRFSDAVAVQELKVSNYQTLPVLDTPKPPSPAMYLHNPKDGGPATKTLATDPNATPVLNGRKQYLTQDGLKTLPSNVDNAGTDAMTTQAEHLPPSDKPTFGFRIDFDNLNDAELDLILTSLGSNNYREDEAFSHKLGMGKPYGCGQVQLEILDILFKDKKTRYNTLTAVSNVYSSRYNKLEMSQSNNEIMMKIAQKNSNPALDQYLNSREALSASIFNGELTKRYINRDSLKSLQYISDPENQASGVPIHYPQSRNSKDIFEWFSNNKEPTNSRKPPKNPPMPYQGLGKLKPNNGKLKPLKKN